MENIIRIFNKTKFIQKIVPLQEMLQQNLYLSPSCFQNREKYFYNETILYK